jgi:Ran GTPase-activating protein (RanGAP) involved in mRNA processing and transport
MNSSITTQMARTLSRLLEHADLESLDLSHCHWDPDAVNIISEALSASKTLKRLDLNSCHIEDSRMAGLLQSLQGHCTLRDLDISFNNCHSDACTAVASLLQSSEIERLALSQQFIGREKYLDIHPIISALTENRSLRFLDLKENSIAPGQLKELLSALAGNDTLEELILDCTDIGDDDVLLLAGELQHTKLTNLSLLHNPFTDAGPLVAAAESNGMIHQIRVDGVVAGRGWLSYHTALNTAGRGGLRAHEVTPSLWPVVLERASKIDFPRDLDLQSADILYYMLRGPALLCSYS